jgi:hypothetical protein
VHTRFTNFTKFERLASTLYFLKEEMNYRANHIVITTIFLPQVLLDLHANIARFGHLDSTQVWIVGDKKTPIEVASFCSKITDLGLQTTYLDVTTQDKWGKQFPEFYERIPYNNETRRNIGYLHALAEKCERLISMDDDNWPTDDDLVGGHLIAGSPVNKEVISETHGYHNICEYLTFEPSRPIYPRGYPFKLRDTANQTRSTLLDKAGTIGVNTGLWTGEPDVDAITWLNGKVKGIGAIGSRQITLSQQTWTPINTQNTCVLRPLIPAFFCVPMGWNVPGGKIQRYGDIWAGYFMQAVMQGTEYFVSFGRPLVDHRRNPHDYVDDLRAEYWGMILTDWLLDLLRSNYHPVQGDICTRMLHMAEFFDEYALYRIPTWCTEDMITFIKYTARNIREWIGVCRQII